MVSTGEQFVAQLSMALITGVGKHTGPQVRILTDGAHAKPVSSRLMRKIRADLDDGYMLLLADSRRRRYGQYYNARRGGSDTTGVALAAA
jgi:hypothetical protein